MDFSKCIIDPEDRKAISRVRKKYPKFAKSKTLGDKLLLYIVLMHDINTPLRGLATSLSERKILAAKSAGFEMDNGIFDEDVEKMLIGADEIANESICRYITLHGSPDLVAYVAYSEILETELTRSLARSKYKSSEIKVMRENISNATKDLNILYEKIFGGEESKSLKDKLYETVTNDRVLFVRPETIARALKDEEYEPIDVYGVKVQRDEAE